MSRRPKRGSGWCHNCDMDKVAFGAKCKVCKVRNKTRRDKK